MIAKTQMLIVNATEFDLAEATSSSRGHPVAIVDGALAPLGASDGPPKNGEIVFQGRTYRAKPRTSGTGSAWRVLEAYPLGAGRKKTKNNRPTRPRGPDNRGEGRESNDMQSRSQPEAQAM